MSIPKGICGYVINLALVALQSFFVVLSCDEVIRYRGGLFVAPYLCPWIDFSLSSSSSTTARAGWYYCRQRGAGNKSLVFTSRPAKWSENLGGAMWRRDFIVNCTQAECVVKCKDTRASHGVSAFRNLHRWPCQNSVKKVSFGLRLWQGKRLRWHSLRCSSLKRRWQLAAVQRVCIDTFV